MSMIRSVIALAGLLFCTGSFAQSYSAAAASNAKGQANIEMSPPAGTISLIAGEVSIIKPGKPSRRVAMGDAVNEGDILVTGKESEVHLAMLDSGFIALRPNTRFKIVSYKADGEEDDQGVFRLIVGGLRSITGWIGKFNKKSYQMRTPTATIGVRGTDHETRYIPIGSTEGEPGTYDKVFAGETTITTSAGQANVIADHAGFVSDQTGRRPRLLGSIPKFFRPGPNEDLINKKHAEIQKMIEQRRDERRKVIEQKRAALGIAREEMKAQYEKSKDAKVQAKVSAEALHEQNEAQLSILHERETALQERQNAIQAMRKTILEMSAGEIRKNKDLREQLKAVREAAKKNRTERDEIQEARKKLYEKNMTTTQERQAAAEEQRRHAEAQFAVFLEEGKKLQEKQKSNQEMRRTIHEKNAADLGKNENQSEQFKTTREAIEKANREEKDIHDALNALFEDNISAAEARIVAAQAQRRQTQGELTALSEKEEALREKQKVNEKRLEAIQERSASYQMNNKELLGLLKTVRRSAEEVRKERQEIQSARKSMHEKTMASIGECQSAVLQELKTIREKHRDMQEKSMDLQKEREAMQLEIKTLYQQEQIRYREELKADREQQVTTDAQETTNP